MTPISHKVLRFSLPPCDWFCEWWCILGSALSFAKAGANVLWCHLCLWDSSIGRNSAALLKLVVVPEWGNTPQFQRRLSYTAVNTFWLLRDEDYYNCLWVCHMDDSLSDSFVDILNIGIAVNIGGFHRAYLILTRLNACDFCVLKGNFGMKVLKFLKCRDLNSVSIWLKLMHKRLK